MRSRLGVSRELPIVRRRCPIVAALAVEADPVALEHPYKPSIPDIRSAGGQLANDPARPRLRWVAGASLVLGDEMVGALWEFCRPLVVRCLMLSKGIISSYG
jgi:hypothetical protein